MEFCNMADKEFKIDVLKKLNELKKKKLGKTICGIALKN